MTQLDFDPFLRDADALIIVPPFASLDRPSLGAHPLQACAREAGLRVSVLYANLILGSEMGEIKYQAICYAPTSDGRSRSRLPRAGCSSTSISGTRIHPRALRFFGLHSSFSRSLRSARSQNTVGSKANSGLNGPIWRSMSEAMRLTSARASSRF